MIKNMSLTAIEGIPIYSAIPPQTPTIALSVLDFCSFFNMDPPQGLFTKSFSQVFPLLKNGINPFFNLNGGNDDVAGVEHNGLWDPILSVILFTHSLLAETCLRLVGTSILHNKRNYDEGI
ncbi:hypothetical protein [Salicibibacter cibi]|uniref:hypothetical protein n=1 Tax=Salicibibacter cibi TaxID=2743001 RepID=UPI0031B63545